MDKARSFDCPNCGGSLEFSSSKDDIIQCQYCGSSVVPPGVVNMPVHQSPGGETQFTGNPQDLEKLANLGLLIADGRKIEAIKEYREIFGVGLKEAKEGVEKMLRGEAVTVTHSSTTVETSGPAATGWTFPGEEKVDYGKIKELAVLVKGKKKIPAVKLYRELYGVSLKEAKEAVEKMMRGESVTVSRTTTVETSAPITSLTFPGKGTAGYSKFKEFAELVKANKSREAARLYRELYDVSVSEAYEAVSNLDAASASMSRPSTDIKSCFTLTVYILVSISIPLILISYFSPNSPIAEFIKNLFP